MSEISLQLTITAVAGAPRVPLKVDPDVSCTTLRRQIADATKIPLTKLKVIFRGRMVVDNDAVKAVEEFKLEQDSVVHCMGKPEAEGATAASNSTTTNTATTTNATNATNATNNQSGVSLRIAAPTLASSSSAASAPAASTISEAPLTTALATLRARNPPPVIETAVTTLDKVLSNIIQNPMEEKYRKLRIDNAAFAKRLGKVEGGDACMEAVGFVMEDGYYVMRATAEAWPTLLQNKSQVEAAVRDARMATTTVPPAAPVPPMIPPAASMPPMDPNMISTMLQDPMMHQMMQNHPQFRNNPMAQQALQQLQSNPALAQQVSRMMSDPQAMQQAQQMMQQNPALAAAMANGIGGGGMGVPASASNSNNNSDEGMTEEEMIQEAILRSLRDNGDDNNGSGGGSS